MKTIFNSWIVEGIEASFPSVHSRRPLTMLETLILVVSFVVVGLYVLSELMKNHGMPRRGNVPMLNSGIPPVFGSSSGYASFQPTTLYHGTSLQNAFEIYYSGMWLIGHSQPPAVWMTDNFAVASGYIKGTGGIVIISVAPWIRLTNRGAGVFTYEIPNAQPWVEYYQIQACRSP